MQNEQITEKDVARCAHI